MKKNFLLSVLLCAAMMTACSSGEHYSSDAGGVSAVQGITNGASASKGASGGSSSASYDNSDSYGLYESFDSAEAPKQSGASEDGGTAGLAAADLQREMLVYSCTMNIDTLDFDASISSFKNTLNMYGGFIEQENYSDGGSNSGWYSENTRNQKWQTYTATLRIPSRNYDDFCNAAAELGDLRSKNARVENVSREYNDLQTTLRIYEAREERYLALLAGITDEEYALTVEREVTDLQIEIAKIRTRMNEIQTDVAYSYVYISFNEVKEYVSEPVKTDTFFDRLMATLQDAGSGFLSFLEGLLFLLIYVVPYLVVIGLIVFVIISIVKAFTKRSARKREKQAEELQTEVPPAEQVHEPQKVSENDNKNEKKNDDKKK